MVVEARPGDTLYGLHAMFFDQPRVNDNQIVLSAKADLAKVQQMIDQGEWTQAQNQLAEVSSTVQSMNDGAGKQDLMDEVNLLNTRVESRNPNATLPAVGNESRRALRPTRPLPTHPTASTKPPTVGQHDLSDYRARHQARLLAGIGITGTHPRPRRTSVGGALSGGGEIRRRLTSPR